METNGLLKETHVNACIECGKCTANCPVSRFNSGFSPRLLLSRFFENSATQFLHDRRIWSCLSCGMCRERCPMDVNFTEFTKIIRQKAFKTGEEAECAHGGAIQSLMKMMISDNLKQNRLQWLTDDLNVAENGDVVYFIGCLPYFDAFFTDLKVDTLDIAKSTIQILNKLGITPVLMPDEKCCGHDLLWAGDVENFEKLAQENIKELKKVNPEKVIFSCAECYRTYKMDYASLFGSLDFEVTHISEFISENITSKNMKLNQIEGTVTFQDPCRLGRHLGIYEQPRVVLDAISGQQFKEMPKSKQNAICCGTNLWSNCDQYSRMIQTWRLKMAKSTGVESLITSCPKCYIHFTCAMNGDLFPDEGKVKVKDLAVLAAEALK